MTVGVIGAGIGGLSTALALQANGLKATVFEQAREIRSLGAGLGIAPNGLRALSGIGADGPVLQWGFPLEDIIVRTWRGERVPTQGAWAAGGHQVHRAELQSGLRDLLPDDAVRFGRILKGLAETPAGVELEFEDGSRERFDVVVGADGIHSVVQGFVAEPVVPTSEGVMAYRGLVPVERLKGGIDISRGQMWTGPGRSFLTYPVSLGRLLNVVAYVPTDLDGEDSWSAPGEVSALAAHYHGWDQPVQEIIGAMEETFRWGIYDRPQPSTWSTNRVAVLGDAAHATTPHLGQGANQAIEDAVTLGVLLADAEPLQVPERLRLYERLRRERTQRIQRDSRVMGQINRSSDLTPEERAEQITRLWSEDWITPYDAEEVAKDALRDHA
ncbi:salicylate hydroxylase [Mycobacteroides chelonae]|uniref:Salicylate hydroxylase n=1 Tax=Mycobacteroides chelonae TaxID=1774 RepID=A0A1S1MCG2_MYCCH|nr:salicylate hydroxylase [Mycobacteroides chelonae]OHU80558.1 salicylate hydroxylase [Mycobacteroides chelonae]QQG90152.1 NAD(P)-binding protein [Mycobacteroides chelonae]QQG94968.1 NAD(P)-binding protein [Mycobacteroides chelonae]